MTTTDKGWQYVPVEPTDEMLEVGWDRVADPCWKEDVAEAYRAMLAAAPKPEPDGDAGAKILCEWLGFEWDGINDGSAVAKGYRVFMYGQFGWKFEGRKGDLRDIASKIAAAPKPEPSLIVGKSLLRKPEQLPASECARRLDNLAKALDDDRAAEAKPEPSADLVKRARDWWGKQEAVTLANIPALMAAFAQEIAGDLHNQGFFGRLAAKMQRERDVARARADAAEKERDAMVLGLSALVHCQSQLSRRDIREAAYDLLDATGAKPKWFGGDQSPFVLKAAAEKARADAAEKLLDFIHMWVWREDPPGATDKLTDAERLSTIKSHPWWGRITAIHARKETVS